MKKIIWIIPLLIFLVSCQPSTNFTSSGEIGWSGKQGLSFNIIDDGWYDIIPNQQLRLSVDATNLGNSDTEVKFYITGFEKDYLTITSDTNTLTLNSRPRFEDLPESELVNFEIQSTDIVEETLKSPLTQNLAISACYIYETNAQINLFADLSGLKERSNAAEPMQKISTSQGQGSPVGVSNIDYQARPSNGNVKHIVYLTLEQFNPNDAEVYDSDLGFTPCSEDIVLSRDKQNILSFESNAVEFGLGKVMDCNLKENLKKKLSPEDNRAQLVCEIELPKAPDAPLPVTIRFKYGMRHTLLRPLTIKP